MNSRILLFLKSRSPNIFIHLYLSHFYEININTHSDFTRSITDTKTNLTKVFKIHLDTRFVEVKINGELPDIDPSLILSRVLTEDSLEILQNILPPSMFSFSGFTIMNISDVTDENALGRDQEQYRGWNK